MHMAEESLRKLVPKAAQAGKTYLNVWWKVNGWRRTTMPPEVM